VVESVNVEAELSSENMSESSDERREELMESVSSSMTIESVEFEDIMIALMVVLI